ncbi:MAG: hypothetical protein M3Y56_08855 [Armatimonadota bacterium]|nr:hypothetical protein [Armatimonadota bacterium]
MSEVVMTAETGRLTVYLTPAIKKKLKVVAAKMGTTQTELVKRLVTDLVKDEPEVYETGRKNPELSQKELS